MRHFSLCIVSLWLVTGCAPEPEHPCGGGATRIDGGCVRADLGIVPHDAGTPDATRDAAHVDFGGTDASTDASTDAPAGDAASTDGAPADAPLPPECTGTDNMAIVEGAPGDVAYPVSEMLSGGRWSTVLTLTGANPVAVTVDWSPAGSAGTEAQFVFADGASLAPGPYSVPPSNVTLVRNGLQCDVFAGLTGSFTIVELTHVGTTLTRLVATFERTCNATSTAHVRGCLVYQAP